MVYNNALQVEVLKSLGYKGSYEDEDTEVCPVCNNTDQQPSLYWPFCDRDHWLERNQHLLNKHKWTD